MVLLGTDGDGIAAGVGVLALIALVSSSSFHHSYTTSFGVLPFLFLTLAKKEKKKHETARRMSEKGE